MSETATPHYRPPFYDDLELSLAEGWRLLADGVGNASSAFHQPVLASTALDGRADARVAVLRGADADTRELRFNTDVRTRKIAEFAADPRAMVLVYDTASKVQLRLSGVVATHHGDALAQQTWAATRKYSRRGYRLAQQPGSELAHPQEADFQPAESDDCGAAHFCVLCFTATQLEWLYLDAGGHRRARFNWNGTHWQGQWLAP